MSKRPSELYSVKVGARDSPLSRRQVEEVQGELPGLLLEPIYVKTVGDLDRTTSLRTLDKTDFFTKEIDQMLLKGECRIAVHSAKDLPDPLPKGIELIALTKGVDPSDSLVLREGESLTKGSVVATSSVRREEMVALLEPEVRFVDIRGTIGERLAKLESREVDGVVIAEAALIRLGLTHLNRIALPGETAPFQGRLAITGREGDVEISLMIRRGKQALYFGLDPSRYKTSLEIVHFPLIRTEPLPFKEVKSYFSLPHSHVLFTSRIAVEYFFHYTSARDKTYLCVGEATAERLRDFGVEAAHIAEEECGEGVVAMLDRLSINQILYPHSAKARPLLPDYVKGRGVPFVLYDTFLCPRALPQLSAFDQFVFTSPSTVAAFAALCKELPPKERCVAIGPITQIALNKLFDQAILQITNHTKEESYD